VNQPLVIKAERQSADKIEKTERKSIEKNTNTNLNSPDGEFDLNKKSNNIIIT